MGSSLGQLARRDHARCSFRLTAIAGYATPHERALGVIKATLGRSGQRYHVAGHPEEFATLGEAARVVAQLREAKDRRG